MGTKRFYVVTFAAFGIACTIFSLVMAGGFLTFGKSSSGLILNNYATTDKPAALAGIAISLVTGYPLVFVSLRKQLVDALGKAGSDLAARRPDFLTTTILCVITLVALRLRDLGKVVAFAGACFGSFLIYVAPALMSLRAHQLHLGPRSKRSKGFRGLIGRSLQLMLIPLGVLLGSLGAMQSLS